jgi:hypothetical protein
LRLAFTSGSESVPPVVTFVTLGWTRVLDPDERAYARDIAARATARIRIA